MALGKTPNRLSGGSARRGPAGAARLGYESDPDTALMMRVRAGDRDAFQTLFERHAAGLSRFASGLLGDPARGEEIAQEAFYQVYRTRARYEPRARFSTFLYTIAQNLCRNEVRRPERRISRVSLDDPSGRAPDPPAPRAGGEDAAMGRELAERLRALLAELPEKQRAALVLSRSRELRYQEIGEILGCSEQAVKSLIFRATRALRAGLKGYLGERE